MPILPPFQPDAAIGGVGSSFGAFASHGGGGEAASSYPTVMIMAASFIIIASLMVSALTCWFQSKMSSSQEPSASLTVSSPVMIGRENSGFSEHGSFNDSPKNSAMSFSARNLMVKSASDGDSLWHKPDFLPATNVNYETKCQSNRRFSISRLKSAARTILPKSASSFFIPPTSSSRDITENNRGNNSRKWSEVSHPTLEGMRKDAVTLIVATNEAEECLLYGDSDCEESAEAYV